MAVKLNENTINKYLNPVTGLVGLGAAAFNNEKAGKIANILGQVGSIATDIVGAKTTTLPKMRKGGKRKGKSC